MNRIANLGRGISPYSWAITVGLDLLWAPLEGLLGWSIIGILVVFFVMPFIFLLCTALVALVQHYSVQESWSEALQQGALLGLIAAIPLPLTLVALAAASQYYRKRVDRYSGTRVDRNSEIMDLGRLTHSWRRIEVALRSGLPEEQHGMSVDEVINTLYARRRITAQVCEELHELRRERNRIVHYASSPGLPQMANRVQKMAERVEWQMRF